MKFTVKGYEVDIKVKSCGDKRYNKDATMGFMNEVVIWMMDSANYMAFKSRNDSGYYDDKPDAVELGKKVGRNQQDYANDLYRQLRALGCYDR